MSGRSRIIAGTIATAALCVLVVPLAAGQGPQPTPVSAKNPLRFTAFAISMQAGATGRIDIVIERWSTDEERLKYLDVLAQKGQDTLVDIMRDVKVRNGYIKTANTLGWDLKYARENLLPDGTRQIVIITDKPVSFAAAARQGRVMDYPFTIIEMRFPKGKSEGEGKMAVGTQVSIKNQRLELENYGQEPVRLTSIRQEKRKEDK